MVNVNTVCEIYMWPFNVGNDFAVHISLLGAVTQADPDNYKYFDCSTGLDAHGSFLLADGSGRGKNVIIFGTMSWYLVLEHIDNKKEDTSILGKGLTEIRDSREKIFYKSYCATEEILLKFGS